MLVLNRKVSETIVLTNKKTNEEIEVMLVRVKGDAARIGVDAGDDWLITREELLEESDYEIE